MADRDFLMRLQRQLADDGKLVEAGWVGLRLTAIPLTAPADQLAMMKLAFMAGAAHVFMATLDMLEEGDEPTEKDLERMDKIHAEIDAFNDWYQLRYGKHEGSA